MNILIVTSGATYSTKDLSYAYSEAFAELGHSTNTYRLEDAYQPLRELTRIQACTEDNFKAGRFTELIKASEDNAKMLASSPMLSRVILDKPDFVVFIHGINVPPEILQCITLLGIPTVLVLTDEPQEINLSEQYSYLVNYVFTNDRNTVDIHKNGLNNHIKSCADEIFEVNYLATAAYTHALDRSKELYLDNPDRYNTDILFIGSMYPERYMFIASIKDIFQNNKSLVVGPGNKSMDKDIDLGGKRINEKLNYSEYARYLWGANIFIDKPRDASHSYPYGQTNKYNIPASNLSPRIYEALYTKCKVLVDSSRSVDQCLDLIVLKDNVRVFNSIQDLRFQIFDFSEFIPDVSQHIKETHSYIARAKNIIEVINKDSRISKSIIEIKEDIDNSINNHFNDIWKFNFEENSIIEFDNIKDIIIKNAICNIFSNGPSIKNVDFWNVKGGFNLGTNHVSKVISQIFGGSLDGLCIIHPTDDMVDCFHGGSSYFNNLFINSVVSPKVIEAWHGNIYQYNTDGIPDKYHIEGAKLLNTCMTVAAFATSVAIDLGFKEIVFYGQDLAYTNNYKYYNVPLTYEEFSSTDKMVVKDLNDNTVIIDIAMASTRDFIVELSLKYPDIKFINKTGAGTLYGGNIEIISS